jgi:hypothetical protein
VIVMTNPNRIRSFVLTIGLVLVASNSAARASDDPAGAPKDARVKPVAEVIGKLLDESRSPRDLRRVPTARKPKESTTLGVRYAGMLRGTRVTGLVKGGPTPLSKDTKLEIGDLIIRVGEVDAVGSQVNLDDLVREAVGTGNRELLVYRPRLATVVVLQLPEVVPGISNE